MLNVFAGPRCCCSVFFSQNVAEFFPPFNRACQGAQAGEVHSDGAPGSRFGGIFCGCPREDGPHTLAGDSFFFFVHVIFAFFSPTCVDSVVQFPEQHQLTKCNC